MSIRFALIAALAISACGPSEEYLSVATIRVFDSEGNGARMEVEAHIYDAATDAMLGCASLDEVDYPSLRYEPDALFELTGANRAGFLRAVDIAACDVYIWIVERDGGNACPDPFDPVTDDIVGRTRPMSGAALGAGIGLSFERIPELIIAPDERGIETDGPPTPVEFDEVARTETLYVTEIQVYVEHEIFGTLEVEVHLWDVDTDDHLGCSGIYFGLEGVTASETHYIVAAEFAGAGGKTLTLDDIAGRTLAVEIIEDDSGACPRRPDIYDERLFRSFEFDAELLSGSYVLPSGSTRVVLGTARSRL